MESSRRTYEMATQRLVTFLDEVTSALQATRSVSLGKRFFSNKESVFPCVNEIFSLKKHFDLQPTIIN